ncbi:nucleotidyltransferase family protein [Pedobacter frigidisoli]|uniref:Nucleotidyltransferase family protein n=1 Tax=Pedobacter frigidisoli TaxID=2530455 RepID=A0A4R0NZJ6_9SPHI|nr:nucleotidyltransferase family protein [Pedobacter frigidisoli]TCD07605.1 nucleotidyltransferase family protein [Pedobacter frigidisoli]
MKTGIIILAAGSSSRLGRPKQLLDFNGKLLIDIVSQAAIKANLGPIIVVLGAHSSLLIKKLNLDYIINDNWVEGISSSIATGLLHILKVNAKLENIILSVSDQPYISTAIFETLLEQKKKTGKGIIASCYSGISGTPVLFDKRYFAALLALKGDSGARAILLDSSADMETIDFPLGQLDVDTQEDYNKLTKEQ